MSLQSIGQVSISVRDLDAAVDFYGGKLGLHRVGRFPPGMAFFEDPNGNTLAIMDERREMSS